VIISPRIRSIQVARPETRVDGRGSWRTAIDKKTVSGPIRLYLEGLAGDGQADPRFHGGPDKAVLVYAAAHYPLWHAELGRPELSAGAFGENFTVDGQTEADVCIGDVYAVGSARVQVSQRRPPCVKLARFHQRPDLPRRVLKTGRTGWYLRVLEPGLVEAGEALTLIDRPAPDQPVAGA
jgi:MOSC domain-containing protein YiiM